MARFAIVEAYEERSAASARNIQHVHPFGALRSRRKVAALTWSHARFLQNLTPLSVRLFASNARATDGEGEQEKR
ncbi:MAG: hypothetical protein UZ07_CHB004000315 [Chlorobi bacterium OLB7]|nr:MAG: hypothetical protein UZ07_CHB004000315 [Chlorobi bacterium OLB7]